jgi:Na+-transporting NADH:ubiquinone oxidoreductase subunit F
MKLLMLRKLHKWVALVVAIQVVLWAVSGTMFAWLDHHAIQGEGLAEPPPVVTLPAAERIATPGVLRSAVAGGEVTGLSLKIVDGVWVYRLQTSAGVQLVRAHDGSPYLIDETVARHLAQSHYRGTGQLVAISHHDGPTQETRDAGATWQARFDDESATSLYFSASDGALVTVRTDAWRLKDFFWMLHTMDYQGRDDFNNPLAIVAGSAALWVALTGLWLLLRVFRRRRAA